MPRAKASNAKLRRAIMDFVASHPKSSPGAIAKGVGASQSGAEVRYLARKGALVRDQEGLYSLEVSSECALSALYEPKVPPEWSKLPSKKVHDATLPRVDPPKRREVGVMSSLGVDFVKYGGPA